MDIVWKIKFVLEVSLGRVSNAILIHFGTLTIMSFIRGCPQFRSIYFQRGFTVFLHYREIAKLQNLAVLVWY